MSEVKLYNVTSHKIAGGSNVLKKQNTICIISFKLLNGGSKCSARRTLFDSMWRRFKVTRLSYLWAPWRNLRVSYAWPAFLKWRWSRRHPTRSPKCTGFEPPDCPCYNTAQITYGLIHEPWIRLQISVLIPIFHRVIDKWPSLLPPNWH